MGGADGAHEGGEKKRNEVIISGSVGNPDNGRTKRIGRMLGGSRTRRRRRRSRRGAGGRRQQQIQRPSRAPRRDARRAHPAAVSVRAPRRRPRAVHPTVFITCARVCVRVSVRVSVRGRAYRSGVRVRAEVYVPPATHGVRAKCVRQCVHGRARRRRVVRAGFRDTDENARVVARNVVVVANAPVHVDTRSVGRTVRHTRRRPTSPPLSSLASAAATDFPAQLLPYVARRPRRPRPRPRGRRRDGRDRNDGDDDDGRDRDATVTRPPPPRRPPRRRRRR